ncbi:MAG: SDR family NAD(P)-dependent oxidoreductase [Burkholderiales bacterium]|nr:SDR family NAD(P)-dependent oxidoreductase [Anaerolineae bacterium]
MAALQNLEGQVIFLTGAAEGLGYATARTFAREKVRLAIVDVQAEKLAKVAAECEADGAEVLPIVADLSDAAATTAAAEKALAQFGVPRLMLHNAAILNERSMSDVTFEQWRKEVNIIMQAAFLLSKAMWQPMIDAGGGSLLYISSGSALKGFLKEVAYTPAKHGQEGLMKTLAMEGKPYNIIANTITTGIAINTPMSAGHYSEDQRARWVDPALLTPAYVYIARQDLTSYVSGERLDAWQMSEKIRSGELV